MESSWIRLRQICLVAAELRPVVDDLRAVLGLEVCHVDPGVATFGLENSLLPVGSQFLEVVAPVREGTAAGRYLRRRSGDGGYMVITQCGDHPPRRRRADDLGIAIALEIDRPDYQGMQLHPRDTGGSFLEIDWQAGGDAPDGPWWPAGPDWKPAVRRDVVSAISAAELQADDPDRLARRWGEILELLVERDAGGNPSLALENATLRFVRAVDGRGEGLGGVDLVAVEPARALAAARDRGLPIEGDVPIVGGTRLRLVEPPRA